ncbi:MAG: nucleotide exchange factor GrpE [Legionellales bacterium RIFCSPHIGHO2_12_FULL_35_11]|nr:MAG: nucleotide exchange factor GrpE [Legionellales bacterium RIFCSPHIGHO2_12_FULL_35_11]
MSSKKDKDWGKFKEDVLNKEEELAMDDEDLMDFTDDEEEEIESLEYPNVSVLEQKLTIAEQKAHENWEKATRALAELENVRRRSERDIANAHKYGVEKLIDGLLPVIDSIEQALQLSEKEKNKAMHEGLELTMKLFLDAISKYNVDQINPVGELFNPELHEAMSMQESDAKPNTIIAVYQKGYTLSGRVIRPARVIVAK